MTNVIKVDFGARKIVELPTGSFDDVNEFLKNMEGDLDESDFLDIVDSINDYQLFLTLDPDLQKIAHNYYSLLEIV